MDPKLTEKLDATMDQLRKDIANGTVKRNSSFNPEEIREGMEDFHNFVNCVEAIVDTGTPDLLRLLDKVSPLLSKVTDGLFPKFNEAVELKAKTDIAVALIRAGILNHEVAHTTNEIFNGLKK